ncbi:hypothetical protein V502_02493 [Pseudogymnoascus sp. VKM F-4520 (FW-2644)]|nr:hypothetical protein V502_02493 [Pseudogymnoascus sp. VKM F-4520 (FW-2644)]
MSATLLPQPPYPLHESVKDKLDPEYVNFYNKYIINNQQVHYQPVEASRTSGILIPGGGPLQSVAKTEDIPIKRRETDGPDIIVRCFTPHGEKPATGWPATIYYHGGGWVLGDINTENTVCTHMCSRANCVVISVDYRLAPENPWPAAVHDSWETVLWVQDIGASLLSLDLNKIAIGGSSAGGNLGAIMSHKGASRGAFSFVQQILIVPVTDNTATTSNNQSYKICEYTAALPAEKMLWYRRHYLPNESDWADPEASPLLYEDNWSKQPPALILVGELDVLRSEGEAYGKKLDDAGVKVELYVMKGMPHPFLAMDGSLTAGKQAITYMCEALKNAF